MIFFQVMGIPHELFEEKLEAMKVAKGLRNDTELNVKDLEDLVAEYKNVYVVTKGEQFPSGMCWCAATFTTKDCSLSVMSFSRSGYFFFFIFCVYL